MKTQVCIAALIAAFCTGTAFAQDLRTDESDDANEPSVQFEIENGVLFVTSEEERNEVELPGLALSAMRSGDLLYTALGDAPVEPAPRGRIPDSATVKERMQRKLRTVKGRATYARRKATVEPVFGQIKEARGKDYSAEWLLQGQAWDPFLNTMWKQYRNHR